MSKASNQKHPKPAQTLLTKDLKAGDLIQAYFVYLYAEISAGNRDYIYNHKTIKAIFLGNQKVYTKYNYARNMHCFYTFDRAGHNLFWCQNRYIKSLRKIAGKST